MKSVVVERTKAFQHIIGKEWKEVYDCEYNEKLAKQAIGDVVENYKAYKDSDGIELTDQEVKEIEAATSLQVGSYSFDCGDFCYYITITEVEV